MELTTATSLATLHKLGMVSLSTGGSGLLLEHVVLDPGTGQAPSLPGWMMDTG